MNLFRKAAVAFGALAAVTATGEVLVIREALGSADQVTEFRERSGAYQRAVQGLVNDFYLYDDQNNMYVLVAATSPENTTLVEDTYAQGVKGLEGWKQHLAAAQAAAPAADQELLASVGRDMEAYDAFAQQTRAKQQAGAIADAARLITVDNADVSNQLMADLDKAQASADLLAGASLTRLTDRQRVVESLAVVVGVIVLLLVAALAVAFYRAVLEPLRGLRTRLYDIADGEGDLTKRVDDHRHDELGDLGRAFNTFVARLQRVMGTFKESSDALLTASDALGAITIATGQNADETAVQAGAASMAAQQVADHISSVATGAEEMGVSIAEIAKSADAATQVGDHARQQAEDISMRISTLSTSSAEIGSVVSVIQGIAEQTNLLALNATIEAARAGEAGKGFAVVAGEVKDLARATADATSAITAKVEAIQAETEAAVQGIAEIAAVIDRIGDLQRTIAAAVDEQNGATNAIARSAAEAAMSSGEITQSISEVANATSGTSEGVKSSKETIAELAELSASLDSLIDEFRIR